VLSTDQMEYAALNVYATIVVYEALRAFPDPFDASIITKEQLREGETVILLPREGKRVMLAKGTVTLVPRLNAARSTTSSAASSTHPPTYDALWLQKGSSGGQKQVNLDSKCVEIVLQDVYVPAGTLQFPDWTGNQEISTLEKATAGRVLWSVKCLRRPAPPPPPEAPVSLPLEEETSIPTDRQQHVPSVTPSPSPSPSIPTTSNTPSVGVGGGGAGSSTTPQQTHPPPAQEATSVWDREAAVIDELVLRALRCDESITFIGDIDAEGREIWDTEDVYNRASGEGQGAGEGGSNESEEKAAEVLDEEEEDHLCDKFHGTHVKLDPMHGLQRLFETFSKRHGGSPYVGSRCRDALFSPCQEDVEAVKRAMMRQNNWSEAQWKDYMRSNWKDVLQFCRRVICSPAIVLKRFNRIAEVYANITDAATGEPLFTARTWKQWKLLLRHIEWGCLSDPDPSIVSIYHILYYKKKNGLPVYGSARGTSQLEGYHQKLRDVVAAWLCSPQMADSIIREFVYRWNLLAASTYSGLSGECTGFYDQSRIEKIQEVTRGWYDSPLYADWRSSRSV
jgi:hypothetical protein